MHEEMLTLHLQVQLIESDDDALDQAARQLLGEIQDTELVYSVTFQKAELPSPGAKGIDPMLLGTLLIVSTPTVLVKLIDFLHAWTMRRQGRTIKLKYQDNFGKLLELEIPQTMSTDEAKTWINLLNTSLQEGKRKK